MSTIPKGFTFDTLEVGQTARSAGRTITDADHGLFMMLTGGWHPVHADEPFAPRRQGGNRQQFAQGPSLDDRPAEDRPE